MRTREQYEITAQLHKSTANLDYLLDVFGDSLARQEKYQDIGGLDAIHLYLVRRYGWLPRDVRSMTGEELRLVLHVEMQGWTAPPAARV